MLVKRNVDLTYEIKLNNKTAVLRRNNKEPNKVVINQDKYYLTIDLAEVNPFVDTLRALFKEEL